MTRMSFGRGIAVAIIVLVLDQVTKWGLLGWMLPRPPGERMVPLTSFFNIVLVWNRGVSFGMFNGGEGGLNAVAFSVLAAAIVIGLLFWLRRATQPLVIAGIGLVVGGAIGNVIDRLRFGAVVDFLDFHLAGWHWPAFNVADAAICVGVALIVIDGLLGRREMPNKVA
jgi:signal peptidase II